MTRVGWLVDQSPYIGGAELTQAEFRSAAPEGVEIVDCPVGGVVGDLDRYVVHNCVTYRPEDLEPIGDAKVVKFVNDLWPHGDPEVREALLRRAELVFCSGLHRDRFPYEVAGESHTIPPALDVDAFKPPRQTKRNGKREGAVSIGAWQNPGKGAHLLIDWAEQTGTPVAAYGEGPFAPVGSPFVEFRGPLPPTQVAQTLWDFETFVFLPSAVEPFGRTVAEAHFAGCKIVTNGLVGAREFIESDPNAIRDSAERFWKVVLDG